MYTNIQGRRTFQYYKQMITTPERRDVEDKEKKTLQNLSNLMKVLKGKRDLRVNPKLSAHKNSEPILC